MKISIFGLGYVGCVSLGCLAKNGYPVIGVDVSESKVNLINQGKPTIIEREIDEIIAKYHQNGLIHATQDFHKAVMESDVSILCVGTPSTPQGYLNLSYIYDVSRQVGEAIKNKSTFHIVVIRSTVLPGTNEEVGKIIEAASGKKRNESFAVVSNPEFLREGSAVQDYFNPPYTLLGSDNSYATETMKKIYEKVNGPFFEASIPVAEIIKYVNNSYHALKVTFANEVGNICKRLGIDSHQVMNLFCEDKQLNISPYYFKPGFAYGGSCLPKDLKALKTLAHDNYLDSPVLQAIEKSNSVQTNSAIQMIVNTQVRKIGFIGVAFKDGTDDLRYSPVIDVIEHFNGKGYQICVYDQQVLDAIQIGANEEYLKMYTPYLYHMIKSTEEEVIENSDVIIINKRNKRYQEFPDLFPTKKFIELVRNSDRVTRENYEGICW